MAFLKAAGKVLNRSTHDTLPRAAAEASYGSPPSSVLVRILGYIGDILGILLG